MVPQATECPNCGSKQVKTRNVLDQFDYGAGPEAVKLEARVPFRKCEECGFEYTDSEAEDIKHEAICRHLGVLNPSEIIGIRDRYGVSRATFAVKTRFGEASLARWETGQLIQNPANDNLLYLLTFSENWTRLLERGKSPVASVSESSKVLEMPSPRFRGLDEATIVAMRKESFSLLRVAAR